MFRELTPTDRLISEHIARLAEEMPLTNSTSIRHALGIPVPGKIGGDCAAHALAVAQTLEKIPGETRFHRSLSPDEPDGRGRAGAHVAAFKETVDGLRLIDLSLLHANPIAIPDVAEFDRSLLGGTVSHTLMVDRKSPQRVFVENLPIRGITVGRPHEFYFDPEAAVAVKYTDTAYVEVRLGGSINANIYFTRFYRGGCFVQVTWHNLSGRLTFDSFFFEGENGNYTRESLLGPQAGETRAHADSWLKHWDLDLGVLVPFLKDTPYLQQEG